MPFLAFGVIDRLAQVTISEVNGAGLSHPGFRRVLIQSEILYGVSLFIASIGLRYTVSGDRWIETLLRGSKA